MNAPILAALSLTVLAGGWATGGAAQAWPLVTINVTEGAYVIEIGREQPGVFKTAAELEQAVWTATRTHRYGVDTIRSDDCPALKTIALSFQRLPAVAIEPPAAQIHPDPGSMQIPPVRKDGISTTLSFETRTADGSIARIEIAGGNAYADWGQSAVGQLQGCWGKL